MPKKKVQFPKRSREIKKASIISAIVAIVVVAAIVFGVMFHRSRISWILEFQGERISTSEFRHYAIDRRLAFQDQFQSFQIWEGSGNDQSARAKMEAQSMLENSLAVRAFAEYHGISVSSDEAMTFSSISWQEMTAREAAEEYQVWYREQFNRSNRIPFERLVEIFAENALVDELIAQLGEDVEIDTEAFYEWYDQVLEDDRWSFNEIYLSYFIAASAQEVMDFINRFEAGGVGFRELAEEFWVALDDDYDEYGYDEYSYDDDEVHFELLSDFIEWFGFTTVEPVREIGHLQIGEMSAILESQQGWFGVVLIEDINEADMDELRQEHWDMFVEEARVTYVSEMFMEFFEGLEFSLNQAAFNSVRMGRL